MWGGAVAGPVCHDFRAMTSNSSAVTRPAAALLDEIAALRQEGTGAIQGRGAGYHADLCTAVALTLWVQGVAASGQLAHLVLN
jgi:hypothetical protein